jgi:hypothetical protein
MLLLKKVFHSLQPHGLYSRLAIVGLNSNYQIDVVYTDFTKAFDSIVHNNLLFKLRFYGVDGQLLKGIEIFLSRCLQCVVIGYCLSRFCNVISRVGFMV